MKKKLISSVFILLLLAAPFGCGKEPKKVTINIKCPPVTMDYDKDHANAEIYDLFTEASEKFKSTYKDYDVEFNITKYKYTDEKEQIPDKFGTDEACDLTYPGSFNNPTYILSGRLASLDDIIDEELKNDIDPKIWEQCSVDGKIYMLPFNQLQNTLLVNEDMMKKAGLYRYIPEKGQIAHWSTEEFNIILKGLKSSFKGDNKYPLAMFALDNQGDTHIMTLLRAYGSDIFDKNGYFNINTPKGIKALKWISQLNKDKLIPYGSENLDFLSNYDLFFNNQLAICYGNNVNLNDAKDKYGLNVFLANFPNMQGNGNATNYLNGFIVFDNNNEDKLKVSKDFVKFIYDNEEYWKYSLSATPVMNSYVKKHKDKMEYMDVYSKNSKNIVDARHNNPNWEGVRDVFHVCIQDLLRGDKSAKEVAKDIDEKCNAAIKKGIEDAKK